MNIRLAADLTYDSIVDGNGLRIVVWSQGCIHKCKGCHNPTTWDLNKGKLCDIDDLADRIISYKLKSGVTFSGGDPMQQSEEFTYLAKLLKQHNINIWCFTGYEFENLNDKQKELLKYIDVLVDGKFINELKSYDLVFKGSKNQRIIDVKKSLQQNEIVLYM